MMGNREEWGSIVRKTEKGSIKAKAGPNWTSNTEGT